MVWIKHLRCLGTTNDISKKKHIWYKVRYVYVNLIQFTVTWVFRTIRGGCCALLMSNLDFYSLSSSLVVCHVADSRGEVSLVGTPDLQVKQDFFKVDIDCIISLHIHIMCVCVLYYIRKLHLNHILPNSESYSSIFMIITS